MVRIVRRRGAVNLWCDTGLMKKRGERRRREIAFSRVG
jgi:hypothetical protein